jgi:7-cyano-7-deazaguanine synthase in queuosine biosynthesis
MRHHSIIGRLGPADALPVALTRPDTHATEINFIDGDHRPGYGLGQALDQLRKLGLRPSETATDLALLAAAITAADTRISRAVDAQDAWTREIDLHLPVQDPTLWTGLAPLIITMLNFLTGDRWGVHFRPRMAGTRELAVAPTKLRTANPTTICLFSGGLDSFIGAIDLLAAGQVSLLVSHYWDGITSTHQTYCAEVLKQRFAGTPIHHIRARVGFPTDMMDEASVENTLRSRSFLFFALATMAAEAVGGDIVVHVPENGLISLNVPLDPLRLGALSTRTTHPFYMARFGDLLRGLGLRVYLKNPYAFMTKGQMAKSCADLTFLRKEARYTMSCSSPGNRRFDPDPSQRDPKHCGRCVPCLIRRAAILEAWGVDDTPYHIANLAAQVLDTNKAEGEHVRSFQVALSRLVRKPGRAQFDIHRPGPLIDHPDKLADYERVFVTGLEEVGRLLQGVRARPL